jgi:MFS family permease
MQNVGASWLMTSLSPSPLLIAMVQAATSLPVFLLALPAGALADIADRRRLLLITQLWMLVAAAALSAATYAGAMTPALLLLLTFVLGIGAAMNGPAWQATVTDLVAPRELSGAVALNSVAFNLARAVGPALGGMILASAGAGTVFLLNALSFIGVLVVLFRWKTTPKESILPAERLMGAMRAGVRYVLHAPPLQAVLARSLAFILFGSAVWALLPLVVRNEMGLGPSTYGVLLGALGAGALVGAAMLPKLKRMASVDGLIAGASGVFAMVTIGSGLVRSYALMIGLMLLGGAAWIAILSSLNVAARMVIPAWVQARSLAIYLLVFQGGTALGSLVWGAVAGRVGISSTLVAAGVGLIISAATAFVFPLRGNDSLDLKPAADWPEPSISSELDIGKGPTFVTVEYRIDPLDTEEFVRAMADIHRVRLRDGALQWGLFVDAADPGRFLEEFVVESWLEHMRQHERVTVSDRELQERIRSLHMGPEPPHVTHYISPGRSVGGLG